MAEFNCCHGTPETGHSDGCPYDKGFFGREGPGPFWKRKRGRTLGINAFAPGGSMEKRHGENSKYAQNLREQASKGI